MKAADLMTRDLVTISPNATAREALELMRQHDHAALPVVEEGGRLVGLLTETDLLRLALPRYLEHVGDLSFLPAEYEPYQHAMERIGDVRVREFMERTDVPVCESGVRRVPIVRNGVLVGLITRGDLMRAIVGPPVARDEQSRG
jgi:CBS domain-containing protein